MHRFFCLICKKVKRTHSTPTLSTKAFAADGVTIQPDPRRRPGACAKHQLPLSTVEVRANAK